MLKKTWRASASLLLLVVAPSGAGSWDKLLEFEAAVQYRHGLIGGAANDLPRLSSRHQHSKSYIAAG
ncbi:hypothetical protein HUU39_26745 [candidate division KSB1 bacterium]|nr:hypothetical protein [bacterium]NUM68823.1 hypothetical protein [candidate division KSB1 bacterium]